MLHHPYLSGRPFNPSFSLAFFVTKLQYPVCHPLASRCPLDLANLVLVTYLVDMTTCLIKVTSRREGIYSGSQFEATFPFLKELQHAAIKQSPFRKKMQLNINFYCLKFLCKPSQVMWI